MIVTLLNNHSLAPAILEQSGYFCHVLENAQQLISLTNKEHVKLVITDFCDEKFDELIELREKVSSINNIGFIYIAAPLDAGRFFEALDPYKDNVCLNGEDPSFLLFRVRQCLCIHQKSCHQDQYFIQNLKKSIVSLPYPYALFDPAENLVLSNGEFVERFPFVSDYMISNEDSVISYAPLNFETFYKNACADRFFSEKHMNHDPKQYILDRVISFEKKQSQWKDILANGVGYNFTTQKCAEGYTTVIVKSDESHEAEELSKMAFYDELTGVFNRVQFYRLLEKKLHHFDCKKDKALAVIMLDLDDFKAINDQYGHAMGDEMLKAFADILQKNTRNRDVVGRLGGDEFAIILESVGSTTNIEYVIQRLKTQLVINLPLPENGQRLHASFGYCVYDPSLTAQDMLKIADREMYQYKARTKKIRVA